MGVQELVIQKATAMYHLFRKIKILPALVLFISLQSIAQTNIIRVEYYVDTDPGYGNATAANITPSPAINTSFNLQTNTLNPGLHVVGVRSKDANGAWSMDERWLLFKQAPAIPTTNIERVEWYVDTDPGYGNATAVPNITPGKDFANLSFAPEIGNLAIGLHIIGIRSRNTDKAWSMDERWLLLKQALPATNANIERVEWYVDTDPGYGKAMAISNITPGQDLVNLSFTPALGNLASGLHVVGIRSRNTDKAWSMDERWLVLKQESANPIPNVKRIEYYIDTDPGYGNAIPIAFLPKKDLPAVPAFVNITGLAAGKHGLFIRSQDANSVWSFDDTLTFSIASPVPAPAIVINSIQFTPVCKGGSFTIGYDASGQYNAGNHFTAQLSDALGSFSAPSTAGDTSAIKSGL